jgi:hypothetical protein
MNTHDIQTLIDSAAAAGGGRVSIPPGLHLCGTLELKSHVELHLEPGARLKASPNPDDFRKIGIAGLYGGSSGGFLLTAHNAEHIAITGLGTLDGSALDYMDGWWHEPYIRAPKAWRPRGIGFFGCTHVTLRDFTFRDAASWTIHLTGCVDVLCQNLRILNRLDVPNCDGIDPDHCRDVRILGCHIEAADDGIVLKNTREYTDYGPCENIIVSGCTIISTSAAIKLGTESSCDFRNVIVDNCVIHSSHRGLAIQLRDQGSMENVSFSNCIVETRLFHERYWGRAEPIYVTAVPRHAGQPAGHIRDIRFFNIRCRSENGIFLAGSPDAPLCDIHLENVRVDLQHHSKWEGGRHDFRPSLSAEHGGLEPGLTHGLFAKHVRGLILRNVQSAWTGPIPGWAGENHRFIDVQSTDSTLDAPALRE